MVQPLRGIGSNTCSVAGGSIPCLPSLLPPLITYVIALIFRDGLSQSHSPWPLVTWHDNRRSSPTRHVSAGRSPAIRLRVPPSARGPLGLVHPTGFGMCDLAVAESRASRSHTVAAKNLATPVEMRVSPPSHTPISFESYSRVE